MGTSSTSPYDYIAYIQDSNAKLYTQDDYKVYAATLIQKCWRGYHVRRLFRQLVQQTCSKPGPPSISAADAAAARIQQAWRSLSDRRIYKYYRDLLAFRQQGDPKELLKSINPREACLVDAAAGLHVRLRLGGATFPPLIFYKIFTHRPITDINAFGPRNYAREQTAPDLADKPANKRAAPASKDGRAPFQLDERLRKYVRPDGTTGYRDCTGWYERHENNGWRPVVDRLLVDDDESSTSSSSSSSSRRLPFYHHLPAVRREERVRRQKQRKRDWLVKLYSGSQAMGGEHQPQGETDMGLGEDDFDLLDWSSRLDFNAYLQDWTSLACTMASSAFVPDVLPAAADDLFGETGHKQAALCR